MAKLGRSLLAGETSVDELRKLTKKFKIAKHYLRDELPTFVNDSIVVDGNLEIEGDFDTFDHELCRLVVTGDLKVSGVYQDHDDPETAVFVLGDFEASNAITAGALGVAGNLWVRDALVGFYNDHSAEIHGHVTASVFAPENHFFSIGSVLACDHVLGRNANHRFKAKRPIPPVPDDKLRDLLVPEVLDILDDDDPELMEINLDDAALRKRVAAGLPILRDAAAKQTTPTAPATKKPATKKTTAATKLATKKTPAAANKPATKTPAATKKPATKKTPAATKKPTTKKPTTKKPTRRSQRR